MTSPRRARRAWLAGLLIVLLAGFVALGIWQVQRRSWKHALIAAVEGRAYAPARPAPGKPLWPGITDAKDSYTHVRLTGRYLPGRDSFVQAVSDYGAGYWVMTPFRATDGSLTLVNRGFVPPAQRQAAALPVGQGRVTITGLLRISEPGGGFLRSNDPAADRWHSRDVAAIAARRDVGPVSPYFIDLDGPKPPPPGRYPVAGLTVLHFADNHAVYALTWFAMAALCLWALWRLVWRANGTEA